jgi:cytochrome P450
LTPVKLNYKKLSLLCIITFQGNIKYFAMSSTQLKTAPKLPTGAMLGAMRKKFVTFAGAASKYPEILKAGIPGIRTVYLVNHPDLAQQVLQKSFRNFHKASGYEILALLLGKGLITNDGDNWHKQRTLIQPAFHRETLKRISEITVASANLLLQRWKEKEGQTINFTREMAEVTIDIVAKSLFTTDVTPADIQTVWRSVNYLNESIDAMLDNPFRLPWMMPTPRHRKMRKHLAALDAIVYGIINKRKTEKNPPPDLLQLLLEARYEETGTGMSDLQIRDELMTIFIAGHETTVNALSWTWYLLKKHTTEEEKLKEESIIFAGERNPAFEDLRNLVYGKNVMNETMRLYPPVPAIVRKAVVDELVQGYPIKAGNEVAVNIAGIHRHPAYWQNPVEFHPERFENFDPKGDNRFVFLPFGGGPRICIGNNFAMLEMQLINAILSARVDMELVSHEVNPNALITLKPDKGVIMKLNKVKIIAEVPDAVGTLV